jgi:hypothetical protein
MGANESSTATDPRTATPVDYPGTGTSPVTLESIAICVVKLRVNGSQPSDLCVEPLVEGSVLLVTRTGDAWTSQRCETDKKGVVLVAGTQSEFKLPPGQHEYAYFWCQDDALMTKVEQGLEKASQEAVRTGDNSKLGVYTRSVGFSEFQTGYEDLDSLLYDTHSQRLFRQVYDDPEKDDGELLGPARGIYGDWLKLAALFGNLTTTGPKGLPGLVAREKAAHLGLPATHRYLVARRPAFSVVLLGEILCRMLLQCQSKAAASFGPFNVAHELVELTRSFHAGDVLVDELIRAATGAKKAEATVTTPFGNETWNNAPFRKYAHDNAEHWAKPRRQVWDEVHDGALKTALGRAAPPVWSEETLPVELTMQYFDLFRLGVDRRYDGWLSPLAAQKRALRSSEIPATIAAVTALFVKHAPFPAMLTDLAAHLCIDEIGKPGPSADRPFIASQDDRERMLERYLEGAVRCEHRWWEGLFPEKTTVRSPAGARKTVFFAPADYKTTLAPFLDVVFPPGKHRGRVFDEFFHDHGWDIVGWICASRTPADRRTAYLALCRSTNRFLGVLGEKRVELKDLHLSLDPRTRKLKVTASKRPPATRPSEPEEQSEPPEEGGSDGEEAHGTLSVVLEKIADAKAAQENHESLDDVQDMHEHLEEIDRARRSGTEIEIDHLSGMDSVVKGLMLVAASFELVEALGELHEQAKRESLRTYIELTEKVASGIEQLSGVMLSIAQNANDISAVLGAENGGAAAKFFDKMGTLERTFSKAGDVAGTVGDVVGMVKYVWDGAQLLVQGDATRARGTVDGDDRGKLMTYQGAADLAGGVVALGATALVLCSGGIEVMLVASGPIGWIVGLPLVAVDAWFNWQEAKATSSCEDLKEKLDAEIAIITCYAKESEKGGRYKQRFATGALPFQQLRSDITGAVRTRYPA